MSYKFNGVDVSAWGVAPMAEDGGVMLDGVFDLPKRTGETEHNWGTEVEAYVEREDITLDGRKLSMKLMLKAADGDDYAVKLAGFKRACIELRRLECEFGVLEVLVKDEVGVEELPEFRAVITLSLWQQAVALPLPPVEAGSGGVGLDGYGLKEEFGFVVGEWKDVRSVGKRIEVPTTELYLRTGFRERMDVVVGCCARGNSWQELHGRMMRFYALCMLPGARRLRLPNGEDVEVYFKEGVTVTADYGFVLMFDLKMRMI